MKTPTPQGSIPSGNTDGVDASQITDLGSLEALTEYEPSSGDDYEVIQATIIWGNKNNC